MIRWSRLPGEKPPRKKRRNEEDQIHIHVVHQLRQDYPGLLFIHPANGGRRSKREAQKLKAMGVIAGTPDLLFWYTQYIATHRGLYRPVLFSGAIELKSSTGRLAPEQKAWRDRFEAVGGRWALCRSYDEVKRALTSWGVRPGC